ncbi:MAG TPA: indolepyruvate ferredoxin oxidoreductase subunit alpha [Tissierellia bacterium]|nr:indolepyruvate ferredoxin oxidoreductase subunit alpha [Tissierellia bacterium]
MEKRVITGNQAIARGFYEAGGRVAASYPGSPTVELLEAIKDYPEIYAEFSTNEKVALEVAIGASMGGVRSLCSMKHVGVNIAMDPLMTFTQTPISGGFVLVTGDDPGMSSSQNEQDNRILGKFANMPILDPSDAQEAKDMTKLAFDLSEQYLRPVMLRITSRLCHSRSIVRLEEPTEPIYKPFVPDTASYCMLPPYTYEAQHRMKDKMAELAQAAADLDINRLEHRSDEVLIITSGLMYHNLRSVSDEISVYKLGLVYPLPIDYIKQLAEKYQRIIVLEEMMPFIEDELKIHGIACEGKNLFSFTGELNIEDIELGLLEGGVLTEAKYAQLRPIETTPRAPLFCAGCPHRPVFDILKKTKAITIGDIGCYSMGLLYPFEVLKTNISMGASLGMVKGMRKAMDMNGDHQPLVAVIGDGTFFHSGLSGFANLQYQMSGEENITYLVLDNSTTAMTGGQPTSGSKSMDGAGQSILLDDVLKSMGFTDIQRIDQFKYKQAAQIIGDAIKRPGIKIIITSRPCALHFKIREPHFYVDPKICIACRSCIRTNCPPLRMKEYEGIGLKSSIDPAQCVGCSICAQVCPVNAIKRFGDEAKGGSDD